MKAKIIKTGNISKFDKEFPYNAWPTVISLKNGDLFCGFSGFRTQHVCPFGKVAVARSTDGGYTWSDPHIVINTPLDDRDAGLLEVDDTIYLNSFNNSRATQRRYIIRFKYGKETIARNEAQMATITDEIEKKHLGSLLSKSTDGGKTFSEPILIPITNPHGMMKLKDGSILLIGNAFTNDEKASFEYLPEPLGLYAMKVHPDLSFDEPYLILPPRQDGLCYYEPYAIDLGDKILLGIRVEGNGLFTIYHSYSTDGGKTFSEPMATGYDGAPPHYFKDSKGRVILTYSRRKAPFPTVARFSYDNGQTFGEEVFICPSAPNADMGYASTTQNANGEYITVQYQTDENNENHKAIKYTIWKLEE